MPKKMNLDLASYTKVHPKWVIILFVKPKIIELVEENKENLCDLGLSKDFLDIQPKTQSIKKIQINWTWSRLKTSALQKALCREWKDSPQSGRKIYYKT